MPHTWVSKALDLTQVVLYIRKQLNWLVFQQCNQKLFPGDTLGSMSYTWVSEGLDLTQMVMDIQKQLKTTIIIIPNNICFNNITKKSFPVTPRVQCPTPWSRRLWTSPRWSWMFCTYIFQISGLRAFIWHLNLESTVKIEGVSPFFTYSNYDIDYLLQHLTSKSWMGANV